MTIEYDINATIVAGKRNSTPPTISVVRNIAMSGARIIPAIEPAIAISA